MEGLGERVENYWKDVMQGRAPILQVDNSNHGNKFLLKVSFEHDEILISDLFTRNIIKILII